MSIESDFTYFAESRGLSPADLGRTFAGPQGTYRILGLNVKAHVLPVICENVKSGAKKGFEPAFVKSRLAVEDKKMTIHASGNLRKQIIRLAHSNPELRPHLIPLLKVAREVRGPGGLIFMFDHGFTLRTTPTDPPYNQTYEGLILRESGPVKPYKAALKVVQENMDEIMRMKKPYDVILFVDEKVKALVGKPPSWHQYYMPD